jgi:arginyl-tRNA synthetase
MNDYQDRHMTARIRQSILYTLQAALLRIGITTTPSQISIESPKNKGHGDLSSNVALVFAKSIGQKPLELAKLLVEHLAQNLPLHVNSVELAGPGFINFRLGTQWLSDVLTEVIELGLNDYARHDFGNGERVQVEFVSANPTGPIHVGNGWWASYGDALCRLLARCGYSVTREYYVNDTGGQIRKLGQSLIARKEGQAVPDGGYQGDYVAEMAKAYQGPDDVITAGGWAAEKILANIKETLVELDIKFDEWFSQASIEDSGAVQETIELLRMRGLIYEEGGKTWFQSTKFGDSRDRVLVKDDGDFTYLAGDIAYHRNKFLIRNFTRVINVWGADHHGQVASLQAGVEALGIAKDRLEIRLGQLVSLSDGKMSKRAGNFVSLSSLVEEIGPGAMRFLSLINSLDQATTIDLQLIRAKTLENPVHYVRYAYARISSIERVRLEREIQWQPLGQTNLSVLGHGAEQALLQHLADLPDVVFVACRDGAPHLVTAWLRTLAGEFHSFYHDCPVLAEGTAPELTQARLWLIKAVEIGLRVGLNLMGVTAPESM